VLFRDGEVIATRQEPIRQPAESSAKPIVRQRRDFIRTLEKEFPNDFENVNIDNLKQVIARSLKLTYNQL